MTSIINFLVENWQLIVIAIAIIAVAIYMVCVFIKKPHSAQLAELQEWLLWAVAQAEIFLGSGTGQLKLRYVYDLFIVRFPALSKVVTFAAFSLLVDKALEKFNELLKSNQKINNLVYNEEEEEGIE